MGAIPAQRETVSRASDAPAPGSVGAETRAILPGSPISPGSARTLVRNALTEWAASGLPGTEHLSARLVDDAVVAVSELVTNAVVHAGTDLELTCRLEDTGALVVEVLDHHPSRAPRDGEVEAPYETPEYGRGLRLVSRLAESWGVTYRTGAKTVWARLPAEDPVAAKDDIEAYAEERALERGLRVAEILAPEPQRAERERDWLNRGALSFLAEASDLLAGQLDENLVAALAGQLIVPRLADWCAVWLEDEVAGRWGYPRSGEPGAGRAGRRTARPGTGLGWPASGTAPRTLSRSCARPWRRSRRSRPTTTAPARSPTPGPVRRSARAGCAARRSPTA